MLAAIEQKNDNEVERLAKVARSKAIGCYSNNSSSCHCTNALSPSPTHHHPRSTPTTPNTDTTHTNSTTTTCDESTETLFDAAHKQDGRIASSSNSKDTTHEQDKGVTTKASNNKVGTRSNTKITRESFSVIHVQDEDDVMTVKESFSTTYTQELCIESTSQSVSSKHSRTTGSTKELFINQTSMHSRTVTEEPLKIITGELDSRVTAATKGSLDTTGPHVVVGSTRELCIDLTADDCVTEPQQHMPPSSPSLLSDRRHCCCCTPPSPPSDHGHHDRAVGFLRHYSEGWLYTRMLSSYVEYLEKGRRYEAANSVLELLLSQCDYCTGSRGRWWERLALNLDQHLKQPNKVCLCFTCIRTYSIYIHAYCMYRLYICMYSMYCTVVCTVHERTVYVLYRMYVRIYY